MLTDSVREQAAQSIDARFQLRNEFLDEALDELALRGRRDYTGEEKNRVGVQLRLICEQDLFERANIVWDAVRKAHQARDGVRRSGLRDAILDELERRMRAAALNLAGRLRQHSRDFGPAFRGSQAINAEWLAALRQRAAEKQRQKIEDYINGLRRGPRIRS